MTCRPRRQTLATSNRNRLTSRTQTREWTREDDVRRFARDLRIPPTSNDAERDLRPAKTQHKISGRLRSEETTRQLYAMRGYI